MDKRKRLPPDMLKPDLSKNADDVGDVCVKEKKRELFPLRIDKRTTIYVTREKLTEEYAEKKRREMEHVGLYRPSSRMPRINIDTGKLKELVDSGQSRKDIAIEFGVSERTIRDRILAMNNE